MDLYEIRMLWIDGFFNKCMIVLVYISMIRMIRKKFLFIFDLWKVMDGFWWIGIWILVKERFFMVCI